LALDINGTILNTIPTSQIGPYYTGLKNGNFVTSTGATGTLDLFNSSGVKIGTRDVWNDPNGWSYSYTYMGGPAALTDGRILVMPEWGGSLVCSCSGAGITPYLYFYDSNLNLVNKKDISSLNLLIFIYVALPNGGFACTADDAYGTHTARYLCYFDSAGNLLEKRDITGDIGENIFWQIDGSSTNSGAILLSKIYTHYAWRYNSPPTLLDLSGAGVESVGSIAGNSLQEEQPTLITLSSFTANAEKKKVVLRWETESEIDNIGFNIMRSEAEDGEFMKINKKLIPAKGSATKGASYKFVDDKVKPGKTYFYKLEDIDSKTGSTLHGPKSVQVSYKKKGK